MSLTGHVQNGVVVFDTPNALPDGTAVKVEAIETLPKATKRSLPERRGDVGKAEGLPADASQNVDHYLYGPALMPDISDGEFDRLVDDLSANLVLPRHTDNLSRADIYLEHD